MHTLCKADEFRTFGSGSTQRILREIAPILFLLQCEEPKPISSHPPLDPAGVVGNIVAVAVVGGNRREEKEVAPQRWEMKAAPIFNCPGIPFSTFPLPGYSSTW